jgi:hypothetical protein
MSKIEIYCTNLILYRGLVSWPVNFAIFPYHYSQLCIHINLGTITHIHTFEINELIFTVSYIRGCVECKEKFPPLLTLSELVDYKEKYFVIPFSDQSTVYPV